MAPDIDCLVSKGFIYASVMPHWILTFWRVEIMPFILVSPVLPGTDYKHSRHAVDVGRIC